MRNWYFRFFINALTVVYGVLVSSEVEQVGIGTLQSFSACAYTVAPAQFASSSWSNEWLYFDIALGLVFLAEVSLRIWALGA